MKREARPGHCRCGTPIWRGPDDDYAAIVVAVDAAPIRATAEAWALLGGWDTFDLIKGRLAHRSHWRITANAVECVLVEHRCGISIPPTWLAPQSMQPHRPAVDMEPNNAPPF